MRIATQLQLKLVDVAAVIVEATTPLVMVRLHLLQERLRDQ